MSKATATVEDSNEPSLGFQIKRILVAVDGSENSMRAAKVAIEMAKGAQAELVLLNVVPATFLLPSPFGSNVFQQQVEDAKEAATKIERTIAELAKNVGVKDVRCLVESSDSSVVESIIEKAEKERVDLIVIGTRGLGGFKRLLLGSVSTGVVTHAHCNVLVVR